MPPGHIQRMKEEWRRVRGDAPGRRFLNHHDRAKSHRTLWKVAARSFFGGLLIVVGVILWFIPGPGWPLVIIGLALWAGVSARASRLLDSSEVQARRAWQKVKNAWKRSPTWAKAAVIIAAGGALAAIAYVVWLAWRAL
jgi:hypothetical protein